MIEPGRRSRRRAEWEDHEILWMLAAMQLPRSDRYEAFNDIAELSGRTFSAIMGKAAVIEQVQRAEAKAKARAIRDAAAVKVAPKVAPRVVPFPVATPAIELPAINTGARMEAMRRGARA